MRELIAKKCNSIRRDAFCTWVEFAFFVLIVAVVKLFIINRYGNATPYWDQWSAEGEQLYKAWLDGGFGARDLFAAHNEHRIVVTRIWSLILLKVNSGIWDPLLQMKANIWLHVSAMLLLLGLLTRSLGCKQKWFLVMVSAAIISIPYAWENTLAGFQSQFYFVLIFSILFLWSMSTSHSYSLRWWCGLLFGILSVLSMASGSIALISGVLLLLLRKYTDKMANIRSSSIALIILMTILAVYITPTVPGHAVLKAQSLQQYFSSLFSVLSWPVKNQWGFFIIQMPSMLYVGRLFHKSCHGKNVNYFVIALLLWVWGQYASMAYGRAVISLSSRYLDVFAVGIILNAYFVVSMFSSSREERNFQKLALAGLWVITIFASFAISSGELRNDLNIKRTQGISQEKNVKAYLCTGDYSHLLNKPFQDIPFPDPAFLKKILDDNAVRSILPPNINPLQNDFSFCSNV